MIVPAWFGFSSTALHAPAAAAAAIRPADVTFNILAPGVVTTHYTLGWTWAVSPTSEFTRAYMVAPRSSVSGASLLGNFPGFPPSTETIGMKQSSFGLAWAWKY